MKDLIKAKKELYELLEQNPELIEYQNALTEALNNAGDDPNERFRVFKEFLLYNLGDLRFQLNRLKEILDKVISEK